MPSLSPTTAPPDCGPPACLFVRAVGPVAGGTGWCRPGARPVTGDSRPAHPGETPAPRFALPPVAAPCASPLALSRSKHNRRCYLPLVLGHRFSGPGRNRRPSPGPCSWRVLVLAGATSPESGTACRGLCPRLWPLAAVGGVSPRRGRRPPQGRFSGEAAPSNGPAPGKKNAHRAGKPYSRSYRTGDAPGPHEIKDSGNRKNAHRAGKPFSGATAPGTPPDRFEIGLKTPQGFFRFNWWDDGAGLAEPVKDKHRRGRCAGTRNFTGRRSGLEDKIS